MAASNSDAMEEEIDIYEDMELFNDLQTENYTLQESEITIADLYQTQVATNQLLGVIVAILIIYMICGMIRVTYNLITTNITNYF